MKIFFHPERCLVVLLAYYVSSSPVVRAYPQNSFDYEEAEDGSVSPTPNRAVRFVSNLEIIYGNSGVPVEFWYNETRSSKNDYLKSVPGCPKSIDNHPWIYYGSPARCYLAGHAGPCPHGEKLVVTPGSDFGICACQCVVDNKSGQLIFPTGSERFLVCVNNKTESAYNGQIYDKESEACYKRYDQGPCEDGEVITGWTDTQLKCLPICNITNSNWLAMERKGLCTRTTNKPTPPPFRQVAEEDSDDCPSWKVYSNILKKCIKLPTPAPTPKEDNVRIIIR